MIDYKFYMAVLIFFLVLFVGLAVVVTTQGNDALGYIFAALMTIVCMEILSWGNAQAKAMNEIIEAAKDLLEYDKRLLDWVNKTPEERMKIIIQREMAKQTCDDIQSHFFAGSAENSQHNPETESGSKQQNAENFQ